MKYVNATLHSNQLLGLKDDSILINSDELREVFDTVDEEILNSEKIEEEAIHLFRIIMKKIDNKTEETCVVIDGHPAFTYVLHSYLKVCGFVVAYPVPVKNTIVEF